MNNHNSRRYIPEGLKTLATTDHVAMAILHSNDFHLKAIKLPVAGSYGSVKNKADYEFSISNVVEETYHPVLQVLWMNVTSRHTARHAWDKNLVNGWKVKKK